MLLATHELAGGFPGLYAAIVGAAAPYVPVLSLVRSAADCRLAKDVLLLYGVSDKATRCLPVHHDTFWIRDYGPLFVTGRAGRRVAIDASYPGRAVDDATPRGIARALGVPRKKVQLEVDGGNLLSNGRGLLLATTTMVAKNRRSGRSEAVVRGILAQQLGAEVTFLEPLRGEPTGHVDTFALFTAANTVVVGAYDPTVDPVNAARLDRNAARLAALATPTGPLKVVRLPMPPRQARGVFPTYTNVIFANGALLVPSYRAVDLALEARAHRTLARLLPGWRVVPIDATKIIEYGGALHCLSSNVPAQ